MEFKKRFAVLIIAVSYLCAIFSFTAAYAQTPYETLPVMHVDHEQKLHWQRLSLSAPEFRPNRALQRNFTSSMSLLNHLNYNPVERNQGACGNCWAWAGTGAMEIAMDLQEGISDRLSVQFINSCNAAKPNCSGGWLSDVADFYTGQGFTIPWSNTNAYWQSGDGSSRSCSIIGTTPSYGIQSIAEQQVATHGVGQAQAIANIKAALNENKPIWFGFFMATNADWDVFRSFWSTQNEAAVWSNFFFGQPWADGGGHAVLIVGYNDDDPGNRYWIALNSWGTAGGNRPNGLFRVSMDIDYDGADASGSYNVYFQTLDVSFDTGVPAPVLNAEPPTTPGTSNTISWTPGTAASLSRSTGQDASNLSSGRADSKGVKRMNPPLPLDSHSSLGDLESASAGVYARLTIDDAVQIYPGDSKLNLSKTPPGMWGSIFNETFEGTFPGANWTLYGSPTWNSTSYAANSGSYSAWCAASSVSPSSGYPNNMNSWMVYGPFSLADAGNARVNFLYKNTSELNWDWFKWLASTDGVNFYGYRTSGTQSTWLAKTFDLTTVPTLGNLAGQSQVWLAFNFWSDSTISGMAGAFVDDIVIEKDATASQPDLAPYTPSVWNYSIPIGNTQLAGSAVHSFDGPFYTDQTLYFNWSSTNQGAAAAGAYRIHVEVTGTGGGSWNWDLTGNAVGSYTYLTNDLAVGPLAAGDHTFKIWVDYLGAVAESNEGNNYYERTIYVAEPTTPDLSPNMLSGWNDQLPIGITQLGGSDIHSYSGSYNDSQTLYVNWSSINQGASAAGAYRVHLEVSGTGGGSYNWDLTGNAVGSYTYLTNDMAVGPLSAGTHTFSLWIDYLGQVSETNESNNYYERTINVITITPPEFYAECSDNSGFSAPRNSGWISGMEYTFTGLTGGTTYWYRVKSRQSGDESLWSNVEFSQQEASGLNPPTLSSPSDGAGSQPISIGLNWVDTNSSPQETGYRVRIRTSGGSYSNYTTGQDSTSYSPSLSYSTTYYWNVQAIGNGSSTSDSGWANGGTDWSFQTTAAPQNVCHPADTDCDMRIAINEMTAYGAAWKTGQTWINPPNPIPINYVTNAGYIWKVGEVYHYDPAQVPPSCWIPGSSITLNPIAAGLKSLP